MLAALALAAVAATSGAGRRAEAGGLELVPTLTVGEEYTDNIFETVDGRRTEFTTRVRPGATVGYRTPYLVWDSAYNFDYRHYAKGTHGDEEIHNLDARANLEVVDNFLYLDVSDALHQTTVNVARDAETESLLSERTNRNVLLLSPYLLWRPGHRGLLKTGYRYAETRYWDGPMIGKRENAALAHFDYQLSERAKLYAYYDFTSGDSDTLDYDRHDVTGGFRYRYADNSFIFGHIGNSWQSFSDGARTNNLLWDAGISHDFGVATALLETKVQSAEDPLTVSTRQVSYLGRIDKTFERGAAGLGGTYSEYFVTETDRLEQRRLSLAATGRYDLGPRFSVSAAVTGDRFSRSAAYGYPYRLTAGSALNYGFFSDNTALSLSYSYRTDRQSWGSTAAEKVSNRVLLEIRMGL